MVGTIKVVTAPIAGPTVSGRRSATVECADGDVVIGGGVMTPNNNWYVVGSHPSTTTDNPNAWVGVVQRPSGGNTENSTVYALCVTP